MAYLLGLVSLWAVVPAVGAVRALLDRDSLLFGDPVGAAAAAPLLLVAVFAAAMLLGLRLATWQGPLLVSAATIAWYPVLPVDRAAALHPPLLRGLLAMTAGLGRERGPPSLRRCTSGSRVTRGSPQSRRELDVPVRCACGRPPTPGWWWCGATPCTCDGHPRGWRLRPGTWRRRRC